MKSSSLILAALATTTTAIPRGGLPSSEYTCDNGYTATCCRSSLNQLGGGPNVADCSSHSRSETWGSFTGDCQNHYRTWGHCCESVVANLYTGGVSTGMDCYPPPGPSHTSLKKNPESNSLAFETEDGNLVSFNQPLPAVESIANLEVNFDLSSYLPANGFGTTDGQFEATAGTLFPDELFE